MRMIFIFFFLISLTLGAPLTAQQQAETELPTYTPEQRWGRASSQFTVSFVAGISYAKSMGQTAEQYGEYLAKLFAPGWGEPGSGTLNIIRGVRRNVLLWTNAEFEITEKSEVSVTGRLNRPWARYFGEDKTWYGVTLDEFEKCFSVFNHLLAEYLGLGYKEEIKEDWLYLTFSLKK
ncbi:MAG: hypothetical protein JSV17_13200 [Candidatus Aminicenantes bacterium]|nr:MAG: hypothetical protein JSV17_13200 [Candidatus Aminicenantes bacterium]